MRYFCDADDLKIVSKCKNGRFIVSFPMGEVQNKYGRTVTKIGYTLMDKLGRIFDDRVFDDLSRKNIEGKFPEEERTDGCYIATLNGKRFFVDENLNVLASDIKRVTGDSSKHCLIEYSDGSKVWLDKSSGMTFDGGFADIQEIKDGYAPASDGESWHIVSVENNFKKCSEDFDFIITTSSKYYDANRGDEHYVLELKDGRFERVGGVFPTIFDISPYGIVFVYEFKEHIFLAYDLDANFLFSADQISDYSGEIMRFCIDRRQHFFNQATKKQVDKGEGFVYAEDFDGDVCPVCIGYDERGEGIFKVLHKDGRLSDASYEYIQMVDKNLPAAWLPHKAGINGKLHLLDENDLPAEVGYSNLGRFNSGWAPYNKPTKQGYISKTGKKFPIFFKRAGDFSEGLAVTRTLDDRLEIYDAKAVSLTNISEFVKKIDERLSRFENLPEEFYGDKPLLDELYTHAMKGLYEKAMQSGMTRDAAYRKVARLFEKVYKNALKSKSKIKVKI